jgi:signal transduction histidine kinase
VGQPDPAPTACAIDERADRDGTALIAAIAGGIALQRHVDRPLRNLVSSVDAYDPDRLSHAPMSENGPEEIAAVARAFNRLTERIAGHEAERALMLGAVSHDLRTPLTRLRLLLDMMRAAPIRPDDTRRATGGSDRSHASPFLDLPEV